MRDKTKAAAAVLLGAFALTGCATSGALEEAMNEQRSAWETAIQEERSERMSADERLADDIAQLRQDLQALRSDFNAEIQAVARGLQFALPVHFGFDEAEVRSAAQPALERFADIVNRHYTGAMVTVEGFADPAGPAAYNRTLAERRAQAVRDRLMEIGIQAQLRAVGYGEDRLVVDGASKDDPGAELNRRVVFVIETPAGAVESSGD